MQRYGLKAAPDLVITRKQGSIMNTKELLAYIKDEVVKATPEKNKDAVNMHLVVKHAEELKDIDPIDFVTAIGRKDSYATEFRKGIKLAKVIKEKGL